MKQNIVISIQQDVPVVDLPLDSDSDHSNQNKLIVKPNKLVNQTLHLPLRN